MENLEKIIEHLLTYMSLATENAKGAMGVRKISSVKVFGIKDLKYWDGAEPFFGDSWGEAHEVTERLNSKERFFFNPDTITAKDVWPFDIKTIIPRSGPNGRQDKLSVEDGGFTLCRVRSLTSQETRGRFYASYATELAGAFIFPNGEFSVNKTWYGSATGRKPWKEYQLGLPGVTNGAIDRTQYLRNKEWQSGEKDIQENWRSIHASMAIAFNRYYEWTVKLGYEGYPSLLFVTDPIGAMEVFRLRDIPEGKGRRAALRNWVTQHWRKKRKDDDEAIIKVRKHLRGIETFHWNGLSCTISPSADDLKTNEHLKIEREKEKTIYVT